MKITTIGTGMTRILALSFSIFLFAGCEVNGEAGVYPPSEDASYGVNNLYTEGVDDNGNVWLALAGSFPPYGNSVDVVCDGVDMNANVVSQNESQLEIAIPAATQYQNCDFSVFSDGTEIAEGSGGITGMELNGSSVALDANPNYLDVTLAGDFFVEQLQRSSLGVLANCGGGSFSPRVLGEQPNTMTVQIPNPGPGFQESCSFEVIDTFANKYGDSVTIASPSLTANIAGF